jgi:hypothetical protein
MIQKAAKNLQLSSMRNASTGAKDATDLMAQQT